MECGTRGSPRRREHSGRSDDIETPKWFLWNLEPLERQRSESSPEPRAPTSILSFRWRPRNGNGCGPRPGTPRPGTSTRCRSARSCDLMTRDVRHAFDAVSVRRPRSAAVFSCSSTRCNRAAGSCSSAPGPAAVSACSKRPRCRRPSVWQPRTVVAIMAGGRSAVHRAKEGVEDDRAAGDRALARLRPATQRCRHRRLGQRRHAVRAWRARSRPDVRART